MLGHQRVKLLQHKRAKGERGVYFCARQRAIANEIIQVRFFLFADVYRLPRRKKRAAVALGVVKEKLCFVSWRYFLVLLDCRTFAVLPGYESGPTPAANPRCGRTTYPHFSTTAARTRRAIDTDFSGRRLRL